MGRKGLNKNGNLTEIVLHIQVFGKGVLRSRDGTSTTKLSVCHGNKEDYSLQGLRSVAKYRMVFSVVRRNKRQCARQIPICCLVVRAGGSIWFYTVKHCTSMPLLLTPTGFILWVLYNYTSVFSVEGYAGILNFTLNHIHLTFEAQHLDVFDKMTTNLSRRSHKAVNKHAHVAQEQYKPHIL